MDNAIKSTIIAGIVIGIILASVLFLMSFDKIETASDPELKKSVALSESVGISEPIIESVNLPEFGDLGSEHENAQIFVVISGYTVDFSGLQYQLTSEYIHFENNEGSVIHRHATGVTLGFFFETMGIQLSKNCFSFDEGSYCTNSEHTLEFYVNAVKLDKLDSYVVQQGDRIVISYGNDSLSIIHDSLESI